MYKWSILNVSQLVWKCQRMNNRTRCDIFRNIRIYRIQMEKIALIAKESSYILFSSSCCRYHFRSFRFINVWENEFLVERQNWLLFFPRMKNRKHKGKFQMSILSQSYLNRWANHHFHWTYVNFSRSLIVPHYCNNYKPKMLRKSNEC
jgi:hypothetical protein